MGSTAGHQPDDVARLGLGLEFEVVETLRLLRRVVKPGRGHSDILLHHALEKFALKHLRRAVAEHFLHAVGDEENLALERCFPDELAGNVYHLAEPRLADAQFFLNQLLGLVGGGKLAVVHLDLRHQRQVAQHSQVFRARHPGLVIEHAEHPHDAAVDRRDRVAHVKGGGKASR